jgi:NADH-quinone oxidoreductase subunit A
MRVEYLSILTYLGLSLAITVLILTLSYILAPHARDPEKVSPYECGFSPFEDARNQFEVKFYLVAILFIIFDLEVSYLFPWSIMLGSLSYFGFWTMIIFLLILTLGFIYEWRKGALNW